MQLIQDKLDVKNKTRANLFNWRGQFTPQFVDYILENFAANGAVVAEPFSGSGTVLLECARRNLSCYGYEINPAAYAMSKFFTICNILPQARLELISSFKKKTINLLSRYHGLPIFIAKDSYRDSFSNLMEFSRELFTKMDNTFEKILAVNTLFTAEDYRNGSLELSVEKAVNYIADCCMRLPYTNKPIYAHLGDARLLHDGYHSKFNLIFTSPPYINVFNYHQNHRAIIETLGWDILKIAECEIGSNRKNRGNRFKTVIQYCLDMELALNSFWNSLTSNGSVVIVVGKESNVRKIPFLNSEIVKDIASNMNSFEDIQNFTRTFNNKFGLDIKEDIIILKKSSKQPILSTARNVALSHLQSSLESAPVEVSDDIVDAITSIKAITPSPFLFAGGGLLF